MHKPSIYGIIGLTVFGVAYDSGFFGSQDGYDHSAIVSIPASTGTVTLSNGIVYVTQAVTGEDIAIPPPGSAAKATRRSV
jgi:hypothetical protein